MDRRRALFPTLALAALAAAAPPLAPPVSRPAATTAAPSEAATASAAPPAASPAPPAAPSAPGGGSEQSYLTALAAAAGAGADPLLDKSLMTTMSRLLAVGRCADAQSLATANGRAALAAAAKRVCAGK